MARPCIVVAGFGRCGSSLMMQMLSAAGIRCLGKYPDFEDDKASPRLLEPTWFSSLANIAVKVLEPSRCAIRDMPNHVVIWLDRNPKQQAKSAVKFLRADGHAVARHSVGALAESYRKDRNAALAAVGIPGGCPAITISFESLIGHPIVASQKVAKFLSGYGYDLDPEVMAGEVRTRRPECLPYMMEFQLLEEANQ